jgi:acyl carrier protein
MQDRQGIRRTLLTLLEMDTGLRPENFEDQTRLREGLGLDSVDVVSIVSQIERQFRIRMTHQELGTLVTVGNLLDLLETKLQTASSSSSEAA